MTRDEFSAAFVRAIDRQEFMVPHTPGWKSLLELVWEELSVQVSEKRDDSMHPREGYAAPQESGTASNLSAAAGGDPAGAAPIKSAERDVSIRSAHTYRDAYGDVRMAIRYEDDTEDDRPATRVEQHLVDDRQAALDVIEGIGELIGVPKEPGEDRAERIVGAVSALTASAELAHEGYPGIAHDLETMRTALQKIADDWTNEGAQKLAREALKNAAPVTARRDGHSSSVDAIEVLRELVRLKDIKDALDDNDAGVNPMRADVWAAMVEEYKSNKPRAWQRAREVLSGIASASDARSESDPLVAACRGLISYWTRNLRNFQWEKADVHVKRINIALGDLDHQRS